MLRKHHNIMENEPNSVIFYIFTLTIYIPVKENDILWLCTLYIQFAFYFILKYCVVVELWQKV